MLLDSDSTCTQFFVSCALALSEEQATLNFAHDNDGRDSNAQKNNQKIFEFHRLRNYQKYYNALGKKYAFALIPELLSAARAKKNERDLCSGHRSFEWRSLKV